MLLLPKDEVCWTKTKKKVQQITSDAKKKKKYMCVCQFGSLISFLAQKINEVFLFFSKKKKK